MQILCPFCGDRDQSEFVWCDDAQIVRPVVSSDASNTQWTDYLYFRRAPRGASHERWHHIHGCGSYFVRARDTRTHRWLDD